MYIKLLHASISYWRGWLYRQPYMQNVKENGHKVLILDNLIEFSRSCQQHIKVL